MAWAVAERAGGDRPLTGRPLRPVCGAKGISTMTTTRRRFLGQLAAGAAGVTLGPRLWASTLVAKKKDKLGVALVGLGY